MEALFFRQPRLVALALLVILAAGISALTAIGRQEDPTITNLFGTVQTPFPGADPERVETLITAEVEDVLREVPEVDVIQSSSSTGISIVTVELNPLTPDDEIERVWSAIRDDLDTLAQDFPLGAGEPDFSTDDNGTFAAIAALTAGHDAIPLTILGRYADDLAKELRNIPGTELVEIYGAPEEEVLITLDTGATAALGLSAAEVAAAVAAADSKDQAGRVRGGGTDLIINLDGEVEALDRLRDVVVRSAADGQATRLGQIAEVTRGPRLPLSETALHGGRPAVLIAAKLEPGLQVDVWSGFVREVLDEYRSDLPGGLTLELVFDQSGYTAERLSGVAKNMAIGVSLVVLVLLVTLGLRAALIVAAILPIVSLASLFTMNAIGLPIQQMSVTGLIVALGLMVDAGIVMTDRIGQRLAAGDSRADAVSHAVRRLFGPLLASTVTTALSFTPLILLPGAAGDFVGSIAIAVVIMLLWSFVIAMTITPALAGHLLRGAAPAKRPSAPKRAFAASLRWSVDNPVRSAALAMVLPVAGFLSLPHLTAQFFPGVDRDQFYIEIDMPPGTALAATRDVLDRLDRVLRDDARIDSVTWVSGRSAPAFYYNIVGGREDAPGHAQALIRTVSPAATEDVLPELQRRLSDVAPAAQILVRGLVQGPPVSAPVELRLIGNDLAALREAGDQARRIMSQVDSVTLARGTIGGAAPKVAIDVDEAKARSLGLDLGGIAGQLAAALEGVTGGSMVEGTEQLPIRVRLGDAARGDLGIIRDLPILRPDAASLSATGAWPALPLSAIAEFRLDPGSGGITRRNGERMNAVQGFILRGVLPEEALADVQAALDEAGFAPPPGVRLEIGGDSDARANTLGNLFAALPIIVVLSIASIVLTFGSFRLSAIALVVCGLSAGLSLLSLAVFQHPFGINAIIGVIGSIGVSINAAIIIMTGLQADPKASAGDRAAMVDVVMGSSRHIISTTVTTVGGFLPLILEGGQFWPPFAMAVAGGVFLSTIISFYFTPPLFALIQARTKSSDEKASDPSLKKETITAAA